MSDVPNNNISEELLTLIDSKLPSFAIIIKNADDINATDEMGNTALIHAVNLNYEEIVVALINNRADPNIQNHNYETALFCAVLHGKSSIVKKLIDAEAIPESACFYTAVEKGYSEILGYVIDAGVAEVVSPPEVTKFITKAVQLGDPQVVERLLKINIDPEVEDDSILLRAVETGNPEIVRSLLNAGSDTRTLAAADIARASDEIKKPIVLAKQSHAFVDDPSSDFILPEGQEEDFINFYLGKIIRDIKPSEFKTLITKLESNIHNKVLIKKIIHRIEKEQEFSISQESIELSKNDDIVKLKWDISKEIEGDE